MLTRNDFEVGQVWAFLYSGQMRIVRIEEVHDEYLHCRLVQECTVSDQFRNFRYSDKDDDKIPLITEAKLLPPK